jgi:hypothetical protein
MTRMKHNLAPVLLGCLGVGLVSLSISACGGRTYASPEGDSSAKDGPTTPTDASSTVDATTADIFYYDARIDASSTDSSELTDTIEESIGDSFTFDETEDCHRNPTGPTLDATTLSECCYSGADCWPTNQGPPAICCHRNFLDSATGSCQSCGGM